MKTPFGPSLKAFGAFFNDKATDWNQIEWADFDLSAYAATELAEDISIPVGTEFIEVAFEAAEGEALGKFCRQPERYVSKALSPPLRPRSKSVSDFFDAAIARLFVLTFFTRIL